MNDNSQFRTTVLSIFGEKGHVWLDELPSVLSQCRTRFGLKTGKPSPLLSINYIEFAETNHGKPVVLKVGVPHPELYTEMEALKYYDGRGVVKVIEKILNLPPR